MYVHVSIYLLQLFLVRTCSCFVHSCSMCSVCTVKVCEILKINIKMPTVCSLKRNNKAYYWIQNIRYIVISFVYNCNNNMSSAKSGN